MVAVDTNFLIRLITGEPSQQAAEAKQVYETAPNSNFLVDRVIIAECLYVLRANYKFSKRESIELLSGILQSKTFAFIDDDICSQMIHILNGKNSLSPEDACLAAFVTSGKASSVQTFDKELQRYLRTE